jgi:RNA polymerase sigma-70 factor (ECF subfamily)
MKTDLELIQEVQKGEKRAFETLVERHQKFLMKVALRITRDISAAEDVVQDSFVKAYKSLGMFEGRASFRSWLYQITLNTARNRLRSHSREMIGIDNVTLAVDGEVDRNLMEMDIKTLIQKEVEQLPGRQRHALSLRIFDDLSFKEIAEIMDCPYDTAKANYRHALLKLKERLSTHATLTAWSSQSGLGLMEFGAHQLEVDG